MKTIVEYNDKEQRVIALIAEQLSVDYEKVKHLSKFEDDLGCDSLDLVELVMCFEEEFDCDIDDVIAEQWMTVKDVFDYVEKTGL
jgi:acyl carrier protein